MSGVNGPGILMLEPSSLIGGIVLATARELGLPRVHQVTSVRAAQRELVARSFSALIVSLDEYVQATELLDQVRAQAFAVPADIAVAVTSEPIDAAVAAQMKALQVRRVLLKPFKVREVIATIALLGER